jgi:hypothetical protein
MSYMYTLLVTFVYKQRENYEGYVWIRTHNKTRKTLFENAAKLKRIRNKN